MRNTFVVAGNVRYLTCVYWLIAQTEKWNCQIFIVALDSSCLFVHTIYCSSVLLNIAGNEVR